MQEERPPKRHDRHGQERRTGSESEPPKKQAKKDETDSFWDTKWEALELQKKADEHDSKGKHYLEEELKRKRAKEKANRTPSLSLIHI